MNALGIIILATIWIYCFIVVVKEIVESDKDKGSWKF
jgi:hypothetical protein